MNQTINHKQEVKQQGIFKRLVTAVSAALFNWLCQGEIGLSPYESQLFMYHSGLGCEEATSYYYLADVKHYEEQI
ncbi:MAG: hypothetical protein IPM53_06330 [Anaerolineaceae bacterium]|nr:hypothetical protein [Anaerolineaceae bacterium]